MDHIIRIFKIFEQNKDYNSPVYGEEYYIAFEKLATLLEDLNEVKDMFLETITDQQRALLLTHPNQKIRKLGENK